jgi:hypothetical protein
VLVSDSRGQEKDDSQVDFARTQLASHGGIITGKSKQRINQYEQRQKMQRTELQEEEEKRKRWKTKFMLKHRKSSFSLLILQTYSLVNKDIVSITLHLEYYWI